MNKILLISLTIFFFNIKSSLAMKLHEGVYQCRMSSWSPFKTTVSLENFRHEMRKYEFTGRYYQVYLLDAYIDGRKLQANDKSTIFYINSDQNKKEYIYADPSNDGVKYIEEEKEFSENKGSKWIVKRDIFCEKQ